MGSPAAPQRRQRWPWLWRLPLSLPLRLSRAWWAAGALVAALFAAVALGECAGWPFLAAPLERALSSALERRVSLSAIPAALAAPAATAATALKGNNKPAPDNGAFSVQFVAGLPFGVRMHAPGLAIAAPAWSATPHLLQAQGVTLELRYADLWRAYRGQPLRVHSLQARTLDSHVERLADGRASWQFKPVPVPAPGATLAQPAEAPRFGRLQVASGTLHYRDEPLAADAEAVLSLAEREPAQSAPVFALQATGHYRKLPVKLSLVAAGALPWVGDNSVAALAPVPLPLTLDATVGRASLNFKGTALDALHLNGLSGRYRLKGPSLAAVGDAVGVTLPTTAAFRADGDITKQGATWHTVVENWTVGTSQLRGDFTFDSGRAVPLLTGRLSGTRLMLVDLGPAVGTTPKAPASAAAAASAAARAVAAAPAAPAESAEPAARAASTRSRVLPDRPFDLPALRAMDANVQIDIAEVDLHTGYLEPLRPLRGHLQLSAGVLTLTGLDARTAQGRLGGDLALDGRSATALWSADLRWSGVQLERWVQQTRPAGLPPYVSGRLNGRATVKGQGRSTAEILGSLSGNVRTDLHDGAVSHLAVEVAGLDLAQSLGVLLKGDAALPVPCAVADLVAQGGVLRPRVMVLDTADSTVLVDGSLSLATEALDLRAVVSPKDFSLLALRAPLHVRGSFSAPEVALEKGPMAGKLAGAVLLGLLNPLAALIPLVDPGDSEAAARSAAGCQQLVQRRPAKSTKD